MWFAFFNISFQLGLRVGEIAGLKLSDFSKDGKTVSITRMRVIRKGEIVETNPKKNSKRKITVPKKFRETVLPLLREYHHMNGTIDYDYVLQYRAGGAIRPDYWQGQYKKVQRLVGIPEEEILPSTHSGRHTHITLLAESNVSIQYLQKRAGHRNIKTTAGYYIHLATDEEASDSWDSDVYTENQEELGVNNG
jgi:integrase